GLGGLEKRKEGAQVGEGPETSYSLFPGD
ncbi:hypothetical protein A2U01_0072402, partial [Trifolium medium]|nr:hypothetical protein [Trifolium medium]